MVNRGWVPDSRGIELRRLLWGQTIEVAVADVFGAQARGRAHMGSEVTCKTGLGEGNVDFFLSGALHVSMSGLLIMQGMIHKLSPSNEIFRDLLMLILRSLAI